MRIMLALLFLAGLVDLLANQNPIEIFLCIPFVVSMVRAFKYMGILKNNSAQINRNNAKINELGGLVNVNYLNLLPPDYRTSEAIEFIHSAFVNSRCFTMQEAVNLWEQEKHNRFLRGAQLINASLTMQAIEEAEAAKGAAGVSAAISFISLFK